MSDTIDTLEFREIVGDGEQIAAELGVRTTDVSIVVETWSAPLNTAGASLVGPPVVKQILPPPMVREVGSGDPSWLGGGWAADAGSPLTAPVYQIGPIPRQFLGGGWVATDLIPALSDRTRNRVYVLMVGGNFQGTGERFQVRKFDASDPITLTLLVERTTQGT